VASPVVSEGIERVLVAGSFAPDTANPTSAQKGDGWQAAYTSTGLFTVTFLGAGVGSAGYYDQLDAAVATLQLATGAGKFCQIGTFTAASGETPATLTIRVWDATTAADALSQVAANANNRVNFICVFRRNSR
jgi:hypothetical protein